MLKINKTANYQAGNHQPVNRCPEIPAKNVPYQQEKNSYKQLNKKILYGNSAAAIPAPASQYTKAQERNIIIPMNRLIALGTSGTRRDNGNIHRDAKNTYISKTADASTP